MKEKNCNEKSDFRNEKSQKNQKNQKNENKFQYLFWFLFPLRLYVRFLAASRVFCIFLHFYKIPRKNFG